MAVRAQNLSPTRRTSPKAAAIETTPATLPESSGGLSLYDILDILDLNRETGLDKEYLRGLCRRGELRHFKKGDGGGRGRGFLVMRKDFVEWWDKQSKAADQNNGLAEVMRQGAKASGGGSERKTTKIQRPWDRW